MSLLPILVVGGAGKVGRWVTRFLRATHPTVPLLLGGRDQVRTQAAAAELGNAEAIRLDLAAVDLGLGERLVSAVVVLFYDERLATLRFAQAHRVPHLSISPGLIELGPEVAAFMRQPTAAPVVLGTEWLVGATTIPTLQFAKAFAHLQFIRLGALLDEQDTTGPAGNADLERQTQVVPAALARRAGAYVWRTGEDAHTTFRALDGTQLAASAFSPNDVLELAAVTGAPDVEFNLAVGVSSSRRRGESFSTEILVELAGEDPAGQPLRTRHAVVHPEGQLPLTGLGVALVLERLLGLDGRSPVPPGLYFPSQLLDHHVYLTRFQQAGGQLVALPL